MRVAVHVARNSVMNF